MSLLVLIGKPEVALKGCLKAFRRSDGLHMALDETGKRVTKGGGIVVVLGNTKAMFTSVTTPAADQVKSKMLTVLVYHLKIISIPFLEELMLLAEIILCNPAKIGSNA